MDLVGNIIHSRVDNECVLLFSGLFERCDLSLADQKLGSQSPLGALQLLFDRAESFGLSFCLHNQSLSVTLSFEDLGLLLGLCHVDVGDLLSLRRENVCTFPPFSLCLQDHRLLDIWGWFNILYLIPECWNAPLGSVLLNVLNDVQVELLALLKQAIQSQSADFTAHCSLSKVWDSGLVIFDPIGCFLWVNDLDVEDTIDVKRDVILCDCHLGANLDYLLSHIMHIRDLLNHRDNEIETWLHLAIVLFETMN